MGLVCLRLLEFFFALAILTAAMPTAKADDPLLNNQLQTGAELELMSLDSTIAVYVAQYRSLLNEKYRKDQIGKYCDESLPTFNLVECPVNHYDVPNYRLPDLYKDHPDYLWVTSRLDWFYDELGKMRKKRVTVQRELATYRIKAQNSQNKTKNLRSVEAGSTNESESSPAK